MQAISNSKLMILVNSLNDQEFKELGLWVNSPIHNSSERAIKLYEAIKTKNKRNSKIELLHILKALGSLPKGTRKKDISPINIQEYRNAASKLTILIEQFLVWKKMSQDTVNHQRILMDQLLSKQLYSLIPPILNKAKKTLTNDSLKDMEYCANQYKLNEMEFYLNLTLKNRKATESLKQVISSLENSCLTQLLRYYSALVNSRNLISGSIDFSLMNVLVQHLDHPTTNNSFTVNVYLKQLLLLDRGKSEDYFEFKELLFNSINAFHANEVRQFFGFMTNFCNRMIVNGDQKFLHERLGIYKTGLSINCWNAGIYFANHHFVNIVMAGLTVQETDWVKEFIETYQDQLNPAFRENTIYLSMAMLEFELDQYEIAQDLLNKVDKTEDFMHHSLMELLLIKIYYQSEPLTFKHFGTHPIHSRIKAFNAYLNIASGKKLSVNIRTRYANFLHIMKEIIKLKKKQLTTSTRNKEAMNQLETLIQTLHQSCSELSPMAERTWLLKQIDQII